MKRFLTVIGILVILSLSWTAFIKPGNERQQDKESAESTTQNILIEEDGDPGGAIKGLLKFWEYSGFRNATRGHIVMIIIGLVFIFLAIKYDYEPLLLIPIGTGIIIGNIPFYQEGDVNLQLGIYQSGSVLNYLYFGVLKGVYPPLIFLGLGAMTDFSSLLSNPRLMILGAAAQIGIFLTFLGALMLNFSPRKQGQ